MASGKKNYFRHSFRARNDDFIVSLMQEMKEKGYFMWFALIELCSERLADGEEPPFIFNQSTLYKELRCVQSTLNLFLTYCEAMSKLSWAKVQPSSNQGSTKVQPIFKIDILNLNKFNGQYLKIGPKEKKRKEIKEKESKVKEKKENPQQNSQVILFKLSDNPHAIKFIGKVQYKTQQLWLDTYTKSEWIELELLKASTWIINNPQKAPKSNYGRFFSGWLSRGWETHRKNIQPNRNSAIDKIKQSILNNHNQNEIEDYGL